MSTAKGKDYPIKFPFSQLTNLGVAGKFCNFAPSHGDDHPFPHSKLKFLAQDELHGFVAPSHGSGVIQHCAIAQTGTVVEDHLAKEGWNEHDQKKLKKEQLAAPT